MSESLTNDQESRRLIHQELSTNILVEAGAGSGKTQMLAERMAAGVAAGVYHVEHMAAVTFTRKAASELRGRFHLALEEELSRSAHDDATYKGEAVALTHLAENLNEDISGANRAQQGQASIAGERNEVQMAASVVANEFAGHGRRVKSKTRPFETEGVGHPEKLNQYLGDDVLE